MDPPGPERLGSAEGDQAPRQSLRPPGIGGPVPHEDFLFHLYRGSELLQENRVIEARDELEFALTLQPHDPRAEDLLGAVYFRLGLYPRAIEIYQDLAARFAKDASIKVNLALCHLKSGQPGPAEAALRDAVELDPHHKRAWGYLGLTLQRLGDLEQAHEALERGGHGMMAQRLEQRRLHPSLPVPSDPLRQIDEGVRQVAETAFSELESGELRFTLAESEPPRPREGPWHTIEMGQVDWRANPSAPTTAPRAAEGQPKIPAVLEVSGDGVASLHPTGVVIVGVDPDRAFAARLDSLRVVVGQASTRALFRRTRDADTNEVLGGIGSPIVRVSGASELVMGPRPQRALAVVSVDGETACIREDMLLGFDLRLAYESLRLAFDPDAGGARPATEGVSAVQLRGDGAVVLEIEGKLASIASSPSKPLLVRREWLVGWVGKLAPRPLQAGQSLNGHRGLVSFSGEGTVLVCFG